MSGGSRQLQFAAQGLRDHQSKVTLGIGCHWVFEDDGNMNRHNSSRSSMRRVFPIVIVLLIPMTMVISCSRRGVDHLSVRHTATKSAACSNLSRIHKWSLQRRALRTIAVPVLNFDLARLEGVAKLGVGGILFLGDSSPPMNLSQQLSTFDRQAPDGIGPISMADEEGGGYKDSSVSSTRFHGLGKWGQR